MAKAKGGIGGIIKKIVKILIFLLLLLVLAVGGFAAGVYFQVIDSEQTQQVNEVLKLWKLPVVGEYFEKPEGYVEEEEAEETEPADETKVETVNSNLPGNNPSAKAEIKKTEQKKSKEVKVSQKDIEKQMQEREAAEKKRISKLARIYGTMKAEEAAEALGYVEADTAVLILQKMDEDAAGQVLANMEPTLAAQITQMLFEGTQRRVVSPADRQQPNQQNQEQVEMEQ